MGKPHGQVGYDTVGTLVITNHNFVAFLQSEEPPSSVAFLSSHTDYQVCSLQPEDLHTLLTLLQHADLPPLYVLFIGDLDHCITD